MNHKIEIVTRRVRNTLILSRDLSHKAIDSVRGPPLTSFLYQSQAPWIACQFIRKLTSAQMNKVY